MCRVSRSGVARAAARVSRRVRCVCRSVPHLPGLSRDFDCFDFILEWDGMSGMEVVFDSLIFWAVLIV